LRSDTDLEVSLPEHRDDLAGRILTDAVVQADRTDRSISKALRCR
jgi:hypothetical protein